MIEVERCHSPRRSCLVASLHVVASAAKQSILSLCHSMDCFASLAMTMDMVSRSRGASRRGLHLRCPLVKQRAQGRPGACCTRGPACDLRKQKCTRAYRAAGAFRAFPAQWLYGLLRALPGERLFCLRYWRDTSRQRSASTAAPEPHDFAVRFRRVRLSRPQRPPHLTARIVTIASAPHLP